MAEHATCTVVRIILRTAGTMDLATGRRTITGRAWVRQPCGVPLFNPTHRASGVCRSCANGWTHRHNVAASNPVGRCDGCADCQDARREEPQPGERDGSAVPVTWNADDWEALAITLHSLAEGPDGPPRAPDAIEAQGLAALADRILAGLEAYDPTQYTAALIRTYHPEPGEDAGADGGGA